MIRNHGFSTKYTLLDIWIECQKSYELTLFKILNTDELSQWVELENDEIYFWINHWIEYTLMSIGT